MKITIKTGAGVTGIACDEGARLDDVILSAGVMLDRPCGGRGTCGKCRVRADGGLSGVSACELKNLSERERAAGTRLACQTRVQGNAAVELDAAAVSTDKTFSTGVDLETVGGEFGLAIDLGTTTVAAFISGLDDGKVYAGNAVLNRQARYGAEVMGRMLAQERAGGLADAAWSSAVEAAAGLGLSERTRGRVTRAVVVGNSAMHHLMLGLPVDTLLRSPFTPHALGAVDAGTGPLTELFPAIEDVRFPPLLGGFAGSDPLACLLYFGLGRDGENALALDLGTNGEVMLATRGKTLVASTAAGPAFEGVNISCGMRASAGAVTAAQWEGGAFKLTTVGGGAARGLAGSGLLSAVRALVELGVIEPSGRMGEASGAAPPVIIKDGVKRVALGADVFITQTDVRELQKAKAAVRAAVEVLLRRGRLRASELDRIILTGSFGGRLDPDDLLALGVLPGAPRGRIHSIANGAGMGAAMMLDAENFARALELGAQVEHVELNLDPGFMDRYISHMVLAQEHAVMAGPERSIMKEGVL
ncbi:MAG TPA: ASKHA domain-containing protein [bacterium]|nr:ASKHA domain-containing protein [bacterium]